MTCARPDERSRLWHTPEGVHIDVRGLAPPEPMVAILRLIDGDEAGSVIIAHLDREPIYLYPELDDRGWDHDIIAPSCGGSDCEGDVKLRLVRWSR